MIEVFNVMLSEAKHLVFEYEGILRCDQNDNFCSAVFGMTVWMGKCDVKAAGSATEQRVGGICRRAALPSAISGFGWS